MKNIKYSNEYKQTVDAFVNPNGTSFFKTIRELISFSAQLGYATGKRGKVSSPFEIFDYRTIDEATEESLFSIILAETENPLSLTSDELSENGIHIFEEYLETGLSLLNKYYIKHPGDIDKCNLMLNMLNDLNLITVEKPNISTELEKVEFK